MVINIAYTLFFLFINVCIHSLLNKEVKINRSVKLTAIIVAILAIVIHISFLRPEFLMPHEKFYKILFFSFVPLVVNFIMKRNESRMNKFAQHNKGIDPVFLRKYSSIKIFIRTKGVFFLVMIFQILAIWFLKFNKLS